MVKKETQVIAFKACYKTQIARAYGFGVEFLVKQLKAGEAKEKGRFGPWKGRVLLMPWQVQKIVEHIGDVDDWSLIANTE